jgi:hypothetical protein
MWARHGVRDIVCKCSVKTKKACSSQMGRRQYFETNPNFLFRLFLTSLSLLHPSSSGPPRSSKARRGKLGPVARSACTSSIRASGGCGGVVWAGGFGEWQACKSAMAASFNSGGSVRLGLRMDWGWCEWQTVQKEGCSRCDS